MRKWIVLLLLFTLLLTTATAFGQTESPTPPTDTPTATLTDTATATPTDTATATLTDTATATVTDTATATPTDTPTATSTAEVTAESSASVTPSATLTDTPTNTPTLTATYVFVPTTVPTQSVPAKFDNKPRIAVISAFAPELTALLAQTSVENTYVVNGIQFTTGTLAGHEVVLWLSGVSMVNAAMNTQLGIDHFNVTRIIFSGIAGGVNPTYNIGDVVIPAQWGQYEESYAGRDLADGTVATPPATAMFAPFEFLYPQTVNVRSASNPSGADMFWFPVDPQMLSVAVSVAPTVQLASCTASNVCLTDTPQIHVGGNGVSGPTFVDNANYRQYVYSTFDADALDEETASAAMVAYENSLPFLAFRSLSDLAGGGPGANEINTFFQLAANNSAAVTIAFLHAWPGA